jgi:hypothetical protein
MAGWIKLHRSMQSSAIASHPEYLAVWVHLMLRAQHVACECVVGRQIITLLPGQLVFGRIKFSSEIGVSENKVRAALDVMKSLNMITIKSMAKFSIISIVKWQEYQQESPANNHETASTSPADHQHPATYKNEKNVKNEKKVKDIAQQAAPDVDQPKKRKSQKHLSDHTPEDQLNFSSWPAPTSVQCWDDYKKMRSTKRAWITQTVVDHLGRVLTELAGHGYSPDKVLALATVRNWTGLEAHWVLGNYGTGAQAPPRGQFLNSREKNAQRNAEIFDYRKATDF